MTVGPAFTWVSRRSGKDGLVEVVARRLASSGIALAPRLDGLFAGGWKRQPGRIVTVREVETRNVADQLPDASDGCASLDGLPANQAWTFQWEGRTAPCPRHRGRGPFARWPRGSTLPLECGQEGFAFVCCPWILCWNWAAWDGRWQRVANLDVGHAHFDRGNAMPTQEQTLSAFPLGMASSAVRRALGRGGPHGRLWQSRGKSAEPGRAQWVASAPRGCAWVEAQTWWFPGKGAQSPWERIPPKTAASKCVGSLPCSNFAPCSSTSCARSCTVSP